MQISLLVDSGWKVNSREHHKNFENQDLLFKAITTSSSHMWYTCRQYWTVFKKSAVANAVIEKFHLFCTDATQAYLRSDKNLK